MNFRHRGWRWPWAAIVAFGLFLGVYLPSFGLPYLLHLLMGKISYIEQFAKPTRAAGVAVK